MFDDTSCCKCDNTQKLWVAICRNCNLLIWDKNAGCMNRTGGLFAAGLEKGATSACLGAVPQFHNKELAKASASIMGDETMHWAMLLNALGKDPVPAAFIA